MSLLQKGVFAGGCFWCIEAQFQRVIGVQKVVSGYTGGLTEKPTYQQVKKGETGHFQVVEVTFNPDTISYSKLLDIFFVIHDPTQSDGQGQDIGSQYLSAVFYANAHQKQLTEKKIAELSHQGMKIATLVLELKQLYLAEQYHQNYWNLRGKQNPYCAIIPGKLAKLKHYFKQYVAKQQ